jgi:arabinofuranan 3-O-arabinosyltransferase
MLAGEELDAEPCRQSVLPVREGANDVDVLASDAFVPERLVLGELPGTGEPAALPVQVPDAVRRTIDATSSSAVATRENVNPGWSAEVDGRAADPVVYDGWRQGWVLPDPGRVEMFFSPDRTYRGALVVGAAGVLALLGAVLVPRRRRRDWPALGTRTVPRPVGLAVVLALAGVLAGTAGVVAAVIGLGGAWLLQRRARSAGPWWVGLPVLAACAAYVFRPWSSGAGWAGELAWPHLLVMGSLAALLAWVLLDERRRLRPSLSAGRSTNQ